MTTNNILNVPLSGASGTGNFAGTNSPVLVTPALGVASAASINKMAITAPATSSTLAVADGKTMTCSNTLTFTGIDGSSIDFGGGGTVAYTSTFPIGGILDFAGTSAPSGFMICDGSAISRATYSTLFAAISTTWGVGDGSTTFNIPDLRGYVTAGSAGTLPPLANTVGTRGGSATHAISLTELAPHTHTYSGSSSDGTTADIVRGGGSGSYTVTSSSTGSGSPMTIVQPTAIVLKVIRVS